MEWNDKRGNSNSCPSDECLVATIVMFASGAINEGQDYILSGAKKHSGATLFRCQPFYARKEFLR
jgi:hypothetical protein